MNQVEVELRSVLLRRAIAMIGAGGPCLATICDGAAQLVATVGAPCGAARVDALISGTVAALSRSHA
jgi:hypothetical protein